MLSDAEATSARSKKSVKVANAHRTSAMGLPDVEEVSHEAEKRGEGEEERPQPVDEAPRWRRAVEAGVAHGVLDAKFVDGWTEEEHPGIDEGRTSGDQESP